MNWLAAFAASLITKLAPWFYGLIAKSVASLVAYFQKKKIDKEQTKQREEATGSLEEAIGKSAPREERQKKEEDLLNS